VRSAANAPDTRLRPRGSNHAGMRQFNERVVLQAIRLHGSLPKAEIALVLAQLKRRVDLRELQILEPLGLHLVPRRFQGQPHPVPVPELPGGHFHFVHSRVLPLGHRSYLLIDAACRLPVSPSADRGSR